ncbi:MAG: RNA polymerase sigma factor [Cytophagales bacterium]|nr:RNA polymerase sigma factor [Cytophagales bacterium]
MFFRKSYQSHADEALMALIQAGNERAFEELYRRYSKRLLYYFYKMLGRDEAKAQDFLQDLCVRIVEKAHLYKPEHRFETWLFSVAHNQCKNEYRRTALHNNLFEETETSQIPDFSADFTENHDTTVFRQLLDEELDNMDAEQRTAFVLRYQENLSIEQIAQVLNCPEGTVKSRLFYVKKRLAVKLRVFKPYE